jgi:EAL domain-containing protein (putative c-di-GMP-specific phosphodiesterase class I)
VALTAFCALLLAPFLALGRERGAPLLSAVAYLALLPLLAAGVISIYSELRVRRALVSRTVRHAIERGELVVYYQPQFGLRRGTAVSAEALVRWNHPRHGLLPPSVFLPALEATPLARQLDLYVLRIALAQAAAWSEQGRPLGVAVNVDPSWLLDPALPTEVERALAKHHVPPGRLELEITELAFEGGGDVNRALLRVKEIGVSVALDDFGIGHSSLARLVTMPVDRLKIDRSFVTAMTSDRRAASVVRATIDVAHELDVLVVAEGVEQAPTLQRLGELGCDLAQGYLFSPPVPAEAMGERVEHVRRIGRELRIGAPAP